MKLIKYNLPQLEQINSPTGRFYKTPDGDLFPSVTTILGSIENTEIQKWIDAVGVQEANRIARVAADRGTLVHSACENYILGRPNKFSMFEFDAKKMFGYLAPEIDKIQEVHALETRLFSRKLQVAGTADCICKIDGHMYIVDFKTSSRIKLKQDIDSYFMQTAVYAVAFYELTGIVVPNIRILMAVKDEGVFVFDEKVKNWVSKFSEIRNVCAIKYK